MAHFNYDYDRVAEGLCLICAPSLAEVLYKQHDITVSLLDIDRRFEHLPGFRYFDLKEPYHFENRFEMVIIDPPFFGITLPEMADAITTVTKHQIPHLLFSFVKREEASVKRAFHKFNLFRTSFALEYATVTPSKWNNYAIFSNVDLPMIKRIRK